MDEWFNDFVIILMQQLLLNVFLMPRISCIWGELIPVKATPSGVEKTFPDGFDSRQRRKAFPNGLIPGGECSNIS